MLSEAGFVSVSLAPAPTRQLEKFKKREKARQGRLVANRSRLQTLTLTRVPTMLYAPSASLPFNQQEGSYFQLFQERTASELSGFFDNVFWSRGVLQECFSEIAIRHAVIALGALYKTLEKTCESPPTSPSAAQHHNSIDTPLAHWEMAIKKYSHACQELSAPKSGISDRTRLMGSVLLACFDSFIGDHRQAIVQIQTGLGLLEQLRAERRRAFMPKPEEPVEEELIQMFTRLAIQAKSYDMAFHFPHPYVIRLNDPAKSSDPTSPTSEGSSPVSLYHDPIPERFTNAKEARLAWDALVERILRFTETMFSHAAGAPMGVLPPTMRQSGVGFRHQIAAWSNAYDHILASRNSDGVTHQEKAAIAALKMSQNMTQVLLGMTFSADEMRFDDYILHFQHIVSLAREVVEDEETRAAAKRCPDSRFCQHPHHRWNNVFEGNEYAVSHIKPSFSADLGIVPPLFVVATKCRDPMVRRQAIQLLKSSSRREGMWDSELVARIGVWITSIEEQEEPEVAGVVPSAGVTFRQSISNLSAPRYSRSVDFGDGPLGPGGNARYDARRACQVRMQREVIPSERRVMIKAVEFDLRERFATIQLGTREVLRGQPDFRSHVKRIVW